MSAEVKKHIAAIQYHAGEVLKTKPDRTTTVALFLCVVTLCKDVKRHMLSLLPYPYQKQKMKESMAFFTGDVNA